MTPGRVALICTLIAAGCSTEETPAKTDQAPVPFRFAAVGQEPGWLLEIDSMRTIRFSYDYAQKHLSVTATPPTTDSTGARVWHVRNDSADLRIRVVATPCEDAMSGKPYAATVTVTLNGQDYNGCGSVVDPSVPSAVRP